MSTERWATLARQLEDLKLIDRAPPPAELFVPVVARAP
jgi:hypothetical protein